MKISDKTNTMLHASAVFLFLQPTINYLTLLWRKQLTPLSCGWNIGPRAILCYIYIFRRQSAIILCFEETFILVSFFKHSWLWVQGRKVSEQAMTLQSAALGWWERSPVWTLEQCSEAAARARSINNCYCCCRHYLVTASPGSVSPP